MEVVLGTVCIMYDMETLPNETTDSNLVEFQIMQGKGREEQIEDCKFYLI